ncbi:hypothetical protein J6590_074489 [Homalodisca vitripennis]|nr:hypothetical protein J6590_074489 [Homalodisca vitripennis]
MGFTVRGLELLKFTVITQDGSVKYESLVRPEAEIVHYNTRLPQPTSHGLLVPALYSNYYGNWK